MIFDPSRFYKDPGVDGPKDEKELQSWLAEYCEENGWDVKREVSPSNVSENYRADLIIHKENYGWFGIETKYFDKNGGSWLADAHHQIIAKYRGNTFSGKEIKFWSLCPYFRKLEWVYDEFEDPRSSDPTMPTPCIVDTLSRVSREFFCRHGIGYMDLSSHVIDMDFGYSNPWAKVPVGYPRGNDPYGNYIEKLQKRIENVDVDKIESSIEDKMNKYSY